MFSGCNRLVYRPVDKRIKHGINTRTSGEAAPGGTRRHAGAGQCGGGIVPARASTTDAQATVLMKMGDGRFRCVRGNPCALRRDKQTAGV